MKLGFTGTKIGMTSAQKETFKKWIRLAPFHEFHHGDCIGADKDAHELVHEIKSDTLIFIHPPTNPKKRAFCRSENIYSPKPYITRNHDIVDASTILIACPRELDEDPRSGTWATMRYAKKKGIMVLVIWLDGKMERWC